MLPLLNLHQINSCECNTVDLNKPASSCPKIRRSLTCNLFQYCWDSRRTSSQGLRLIWTRAPIFFIFKSTWGQILDCSNDFDCCFARQVPDHVWWNKRWWCHIFVDSLDSECREHNCQPHEEYSPYFSYYLLIQPRFSLRSFCMYKKTKFSFLLAGEC